MFQRNKNSYNIIAVCTNGSLEGRYNFVEDYDDDWGTIASKMFADEFGSEPTEMHLVSRELI